VVLTSIDAALAQASSGRGRLLLLAGEAGIGKTAIAQSVAERASAAGAVVRWGACWEAAARLPLAVWADCLRRPAGDACAEMARRLQEGSFDAGPDAHGAARLRARLFSDVVDALHDTASSRVQVLVLEDLHWADTHSLELLGAVATNLPSMSVLV